MPDQPSATPLLDRIESLLPSARPRWAMMSTSAATHFTDLLLFVCAALDHLGVQHVIHYGSLLGAARLGAPLPWDEDHDLFIVGTDLAHVREQLEPIMNAHGYRVVPDRRGFLWIKEKIWPAASGHLALDVLPALVPTVDDVPAWDGGAPHLAEGELWPLRQLPFHGSFVSAPHATEAALGRIYGAAGSSRAMSKFSAPEVETDTAAFWAKARTPTQSDWPEISRRFRARSKWRHLRAIPWWWFNGGYIVGINALKRWIHRRRQA